MNIAGALNQFTKPRVKDEKCAVKGCPENCEKDRNDLCGICRLIDDKKCEQVFPAGINLVDHGPFYSMIKNRALTPKKARLYSCLDTEKRKTAIVKMRREHN